MNPTKADIKHYIVDQLVAEPAGLDLKDDDDLLISNLLDSLGVMRLVEYIEGLIDMKIPPEDITIENFQSINKIAEYLSGRTDLFRLVGEHGA